LSEKNRKENYHEETKVAVLGSGNIGTHLMITPADIVFDASSAKAHMRKMT
jgi:acetaldehyde dehydrogenase (acetylating)